MTSPLPTFLIVGAQKSGTRWLRRNLGAHRNCCVADHEVEFFNHEFERGTEWYREQFTEWTGEPVVGEATPGYMFWNDQPIRAARRVLDTLGPEVAIVAILRDPVERARSSYVHHLRRDRIDPEVDPIDHLRSLNPDDDPLGIISGGWYGRSLAPYFERFARTMVAFHSDIQTDGESLYLRVLEHIGIDDPWIPEEMHEVVFSGVRRVERDFPGHPILSIGRDELRELIGHHFEADGEQLAQLIGRGLPWDGAGTSASAQRRAN